jgi:hypothetical protein
LFGVVAPLATTGASIASREPVKVTLVETMRVGLLSRVCTPRLSVTWRGQSAAVAEVSPKTKRPVRRKALRQRAGNFTERHPVIVEVNASHFHDCREGMQAFVAQVV